MRVRRVGAPYAPHFAWFLHGFCMTCGTACFLHGFAWLLHDMWNSLFFLHDMWNSLFFLHDTWNSLFFLHDTWNSLFFA